MPMNRLPPPVPPTKESRDRANSALIPVQMRVRDGQLIGLEDMDGNDLGLPVTTKKSAQGEVFLAGGIDLRKSLTDSAVIPAAFFGLHIQDGHPSDVPQSPVHNLGQKSIRLWDTRTTWRMLETAKGVYDWARLDYLVDLYSGLGYQILYTMGQAPAWATGDVVGGELGQSTAAYNSTPPSSDQDWIDHCTAVAARYRGRIHAYEPWNEPLTTKFWTGSVADIGRLTILASQAVKAADPAALIVGCAPSAPVVGPAYLAQYLAVSGVVAAIDVVGCHCYVQPDQPELVMELARAFRQAADENGASGKPMWCTEFGISQFFSSNVFYPDANTTPMPAALAVSYIQRYMLAAWLGGCSRAYWYGYDHAAMKLNLIDGATPATILPAGRAYADLSVRLVGSRITEFSEIDGAWLVSYITSSGQRQLMGWTSDEGKAVIDMTRANASRAVTDNGTGTFPTQSAISERFVIQKTPVYFTVGNDLVPDRLFQKRTWPKRTKLTYNYDFSARLQSGSIPDGWQATSAGTITDYAGGDSGTARPITFTATAQNQLIRQSHRHVLAAGRYALVLKYRLPTSQDSEWYVGLEDVNGVGDLGFNISYSVWFTLGGWQTVRREFVVTSDSQVPFDFRLVIANTKSSGWNPINIAEFGLERIDDVPSVDYHNIRTRYSPIKPTKGGTSFSQGEKITFTDAGLIASEGAEKQVISVGGTLGTLSGVTANVTAGSNIINVVNPADSIQVGAWITAGSSSTPFRVLQRVNGVQFKLSGNFDGTTATGVTVQYAAPTILKVGGVFASDGKPILVGPTATTVGTAGAASAPPATPEKYMTVNVGGTDYKIPLFKV